jgi:outer membrane PBP1 activator LpoA protein
LNEPLSGTDLPSSPNRALFSLSLSQQAEAVAAARHALERHYRRALVLAADDTWGGGVEQGFIQAFEAGGGEIAASARFTDAQGDHSDILTSVLRIEDSRQRKSRLQTALGLPLEFEPSRRDDFDVIFLAADPTLGRQLKPQLRFHDAGDKPILAMSRIYSGQVNAIADQDLNGIEFAATRPAANGPGEASSLASARSGTFAPLQAIGADAWGVLPWMGLMKEDPDLYFPGASGKLRILADGSLHREPWWMRFEGGRPVPVESDKQSP